jgi:hypothetical protein
VGDPWFPRDRANGGNVLFTSAHTPNLILNAVIVTKETFQKKGPQLAKLLRGIDAGHRYISDKPAEAKAVIAKWLKAKPAEVDTMLAGDRIYGLGENRVLFGHQERPGPAYGSMARVVEFMKSRGLASNPIDPKTLLAPAPWAGSVSRRKAACQEQRALRCSWDSRLRNVLPPSQPSPDTVGGRGVHPLPQHSCGRARVGATIIALRCAPPQPTTSPLPRSLHP